ncbi:hypothetical protein KTO58_06880 [Chitinophaga pendula]|uniref:condensation domain-containing protein n=1 Tax=Chitinophaga TaxID=79328 RepID=UPI000BAF035E|nr:MULTISPECIES: condensation domain-containing protein [Chitinophaga]ASZ13469.1 hypothetical protein CK934_22170 [Chitinophaga sp. MD30]UCJ08903.1 hypothetical protein KTO58_06880 [Chitinophaga pendula]
MKDIAIIGIAGRFPEADNLAMFRQHLIEGRDSVRELSFERKSNTAIALDKTYMPLGFVEDIDKFDHKFFHISRAEAEHMDPHQRILMEVVYAAIESSGYAADHFNGSATAVFIGDTDQEYQLLAERFDPTLVTGTTNATTAGRIARFFNFRGNAAMVDTACSSSLQAIHLACNELHLGDAEYALACGVRFLLFPDEKQAGPNLGIMSTDGKTRSFSAKADGSGAGEAVGAVLLKPLEKALTDGDIVYAIIKGTAANQDAQLSGSLTAPSSQAQSEVLRKAWQKSNIDPATITYIEAHGSGTKLGDPIEIAGIDLAFKGIAREKHTCAVSSIKSNIGHTGGAAGMSGLIKTVLSLRNRELYPSVHFDQPNPFIDFKQSVTYINADYKTWDVSFPRRAGVSSFGLSGTNCHVLLEEAPAPTAGAHTEQTFLFNFSARSVQSLQHYLQAFQAFLAAESVPSLGDISYTLNYGRNHYPHRVSVTASTQQELAEKLRHASIHHAQEATQKAIFLFSDDSIVSDKLLQAVSTAFPVFRQFVDECAPFYTESHPDINRFVFQYALYKYLETRGLGTEHLLGVGNGDLVVAVLLQEMTLETAIGDISTGAPAVDLSGKLRSLVERETADGKVVFIEMGPAGQLSKGLETLAYPDKEFLYSVLHLQQSPLEIIQVLYEQQYPINWSLYYTDSKARKVPLPGYVFERIRCWLKPPTQLSDIPATDINEKKQQTSLTSAAAVDKAHIAAILQDNWSDMEKKIAAIWIEVLKLDELRLDDDFFRLGGHSLMATKVISIIEKEFGIHLIFKDIFTFATVRSLAKGVEELISGGTQIRAYRSIQPAPAQAYYPLSEAQRRLWLISQANMQSTAYNLPAALLLEGVLDKTRLTATFQTLIDRHESLRTSFHEKNAQPVQQIQDKVIFVLQEISSQEDINAIWQSFLQPFDLTQAPLLRVSLVTLAPDKYLLLLDMHHIITDGVSMGVFTSELVKIYHEEALSPLQIQYKDFVMWQQELFASGEMQRQEDFWLQQFADGLPILQLHTDKPRPAVQTFNGDRIFFELPQSQVQQIQALAAQTGSTPFMVLLAVYYVLLYKYTQQTDIVVGSPIAGRSHNELAPIIGMFVNTLVLRNQPAADKTFLAFLQEVKTNALNAYEHQDYPFALLADKLDLRKDPSRNALFDAMFVLQNIEVPDIALEQLNISGYPMPSYSAQFDLLLEIQEEKNNWPVKLEYNTDLFEHDSILLLKERLLALLADILSAPDKTIDALSVKIAAESAGETADLDFSFNF